MRQTRYFAFDHRLDRLSVPRPTGKDYDQLTKIVAARDAERRHPFDRLLDRSPVDHPRRLRQQPGERRGGRDGDQGQRPTAESAPRHERDEADDGVQAEECDQAVIPLVVVCEEP